MTTDPRPIEMLADLLKPPPIDFDTVQPALTASEMKRYGERTVGQYVMIGTDWSTMPDYSVVTWEGGSAVLPRRGQRFVGFMNPRSPAEAFATINYRKAKRLDRKMIAAIVEALRP